MSQSESSSSSGSDQHISPFSLEFLQKLNTEDPTSYWGRVLAARTADEAVAAAVDFTKKFKSFFLLDMIVKEWIRVQPDRQKAASLERNYGSHQQSMVEYLNTADWDAHDYEGKWRWTLLTIYALDASKSDGLKP
ncbi:hypothetical protein BJ508DRAFT_309255 [Ascobolus immersus RN42]|uniref:Uncharacterized protein n=1 Tax=Ascobolus immersus RN42 TaxID=1160509 RepID=A0A3N4HZD8_ASCIM|nr:hypothetical protein BJ508DRAFT_309255 [Ascobolus immersus RN42]